MPFYFKHRVNYHDQWSSGNLFYKPCDQYDEKSCEHGSHYQITCENTWHCSLFPHTVGEVIEKDDRLVVKPTKIL